MATKFALSLLVPLALAAQQTVQVGAQGLQFLPNTIYPSVGDTVQFQFVTPGHSVVQGTYSKPCAPSNSSFYSGVLDQNMVYTITINDTNPIFFYCAVPGHCQSGMVGVINPGSGDQTLNGYRSAAAGVSVSSEPSNVEGGIVASAGSSSSVPATSASTVSSTATATTSASASATAKSEGGKISAIGFSGLVGAVAAVLGSI